MKLWKSRPVGRIVAGLGLLACVASGLFMMRGRAEAGAPQPPEPTGKITPWTAMKIAVGKVPGHALSANFEFDEGHWIYGVFVVTGGANKQLKEVEIDPVTGKVGDVENVTPEGEAKEVTEELNKALGKSTGTGGEEKGEKGEKPEKGGKSK